MQHMRNRSTPRLHTSYFCGSYPAPPCTTPVYDSGGAYASVPTRHMRESSGAGNRPVIVRGCSSALAPPSVQTQEPKSVSSAL